ncbi:MAG: dTDP-4-dehydrorhamnose reductase [Synergistaceae bacterium]|jgi:dTDP-4-dehydrorhamnose reductase|nr:dTDP-4-dehydrorhamnose reductase [Synergistaceae bacterium]
MKPGRPARFLLIGRRGQVGWELRRSLLPYGEVEARSSDELNLLDQSAVREAVRAFRPDAIINAAAYTAVDRAESERDVCRALNSLAPGVLAEEAERLGAWVVHYSTDYVFNGKKESPWTEEDEPDPVNYYGESKLAGDLAIARSSRKHLIFRTSWVYSSRGSNFLLTMLRLFAAKGSVRVVNDQIGAPTWARFIAQVTLIALREAMDRGDAGVSGLYNLASSGRASWYDFAREIRSCAGDACGGVSISPDSSEEYPTPARRPARSVHSTEKIERAFGIRPPDWRDAARLCMDGIGEGKDK